MEIGNRTIILIPLSLLFGVLVSEPAILLLSKHRLRILSIEMWRYALTVKRPAKEPIVQDHTPNAEEFLMGVTVRTDSAGFRRPDPDTERAREPADELVVALGDSVTLGWGVPEGQTYPAHLERALRGRGRPARVANAGVGNSNTAMELARYRRDIRPLKPHWIILGFFINDAEPSVTPARSFLLRHSALATLVLGTLRTNAPGRETDYLSFYQSLYEDTREGWRACKEALTEFGATLRQDGVPATLLLIPEMHEPRNFGPFAEIYRRVAAAGRTAGFEVIDGSLGFPSGAGSSFFVTAGDAHPNGAAQQRFAEALLASSHVSGR